MKLLNQHKFFIACATAAVLAFFCLKFFMQGMKKDYSMDLYKKEVQLKEQERKAIIEARQPLEKQLQDLKAEMLAYKIKDSIISLKINATETKIIEYKNPAYAKQKIEAVNSLDVDNLVKYIKNLQEPNDY